MSADLKSAFRIPEIQNPKSARAGSDFGFRISNTFLALALSLFAIRSAAIPAFPGAEGFGANAAGGRGGTVFHVTTTADNGSSSLSGSLRQGVSQANRTIVFDVSGTINLASDLKITKSNLTIAGQTAPGDGICIKGRTFIVQNTHDVVVRYIRCRPGDVNCPSSFEGDSFDFLYATNCIADHITATWSIDECFSPTWSTNITMQWCLIAESLNNSCHSKGPHGYGTLMRYGNGALTLHHNLYADNNSRNPRVGDNIHLDFVNNVVYNWGGFAGYNANDSPDNLAIGGLYFTNVVNYVSNYFVAGPNTSSSRRSIAFDSGTTNSLQCQIFQSGNLMDSDRNSTLDGSDTGWGMFSSPYTALSSPYSAPDVTTDKPDVAYERVLAFVGASLARDSADDRVIRTTRGHGGTIVDFITTTNFTGDYVTNTDAATIGVNPWPTLNSVAAPTDSDHDGIPDYFELAVGWSTGVANNNHVNADDYTDLEWYLNWLAVPHVLCNRSGFVDVNLRSIVNATNNFTFGVSGGSNGAATLLDDGYTARFTAAPGTNGFAGFDFNATNTVTGIGFGPVAVNVLITTTNAPNTAPSLAAIPDTNIISGATLTFTNSASDSDLPAQTLTFSLQNQPVGATVNSSNGVFNWRPAIAQSGSSNYLEVIVTDSGTPAMSATQAFSVLVAAPASPLVQAPSFAGGDFAISVNGDSGPDYIVQVSTNLFLWENLWTNFAPVLPFNWTDTNANLFGRRFYRIQLAP